MDTYTGYRYMVEPSKRGGRDLVFFGNDNQRVLIGEKALGFFPKFADRVNAQGIGKELGMRLASIQGVVNMWKQDGRDPAYGGELTERLHVLTEGVMLYPGKEGAFPFGDFREANSKIIVPASSIPEGMAGKQGKGLIIYPEEIERRGELVYLIGNPKTADIIGKFPQTILEAAPELINLQANDNYRGYEFVFTRKIEQSIAAMVIAYVNDYQDCSGKRCCRLLLNAATPVTGIVYEDGRGMSVEEYYMKANIRAFFVEK